MKFNIIFLLFGVVLSLLSKVLQFKFPQYSNLGNVIVFPAATFFVLAILWSIPKFKLVIGNEQTSHLAIWLTIIVCLAVAVFQLTTMIAFGKKLMWGLWLFIPFIGLVTIIIKLLFSIKAILK